MKSVAKLTKRATEWKWRMDKRHMERAEKAREKYVLVRKEKHS